jgi:hypothetical protein
MSVFDRNAEPMGIVMSRLRVVAFVMLAWAASQCGAQAQDAPQPPVPANMATPLERSRIAIAECRERRLRKELASYKESAQCSNPKIFAAWQEANYPHMDLITAWLSAREAASEKVDQRIITPKEFERQMDDLTIRLTAEEQRRRAGLVSSADSDLMLQLPPSTQVVGVATPPGQEKIAAKKTAEARARAAANSQYVDPSSVGSLAQVDVGKPTARGGVGGPFVPAPGAAGSPRAGQTQVASVGGEGGRGLYAHLSSQRSDAEARIAFRTLQGQYPSVLSGRDAVIRRVDDGSQGTYYRVEVGPLSAGQADQMCGTIKSSGGQCVPRYE